MDIILPDTQEMTAAGPAPCPLGSGDAAAALVGLTRVSPFVFARPTDEAVRQAKILVIDREEEVARLVGDHLGAHGFSDVEVVFDSTAALSTIENLLPDLVLLDVRMKPTSGLEILDRMRRSDRMEHIPVIILTNDNKEAVKVTALNLGANDFLTKPVRSSELVSRVRNALSEKVYHDQLVAYSMQLESDVLQDELTGIANRRAFEYEIKRRISEWQRQRTPLGLLMIDIDHFKQINDLYGHRVGDDALRDLAKVLTAATREMDLIARYGGEEFAVILPGTTTTESKETAERVRQAIEDHPFTVEGHDVSLTVSVGIASAMRSDDANLLVRRADTALYSAKQRGRNQAYFHDGATCIALADARPLAAASPSRLTPPDGLEVPIEAAKIAIIDDEVCTVAVVRKHLKDSGFEHFLEVTDATKALDLIRSEEPDLVLLDIRMPQVSGLEILSNLRHGAVASQVPVLIFTSDTTKDAKVEALKLGANDFLQKPVDASELLARVHNTLLAKSHLDNLARYSSLLEHEVRLRTTELAASRREAIQCLARAAELRDDRTGQHVLRVGRYAAILAEEIGFSEERVVWMEHAAQLHDVGKIGIPDAILNKPGQLSRDEWDVMKAHCLAGTRVLLDQAEPDESEPPRPNVVGADVFDGCNSPIMKMASLVAQTHHERWDGTGYPRGLAGVDIPIEGRIAAVADVFDALSTKRPYKDALPLDQCLKILEEGRSSHFDPDVLDAFFRRKSDILRVFYEYSDSPPAS